MAMLEKHEHEHAFHDFDGLIEMRVNPPPGYFTVLFYGLVIWGVIFCAYFLLSGWSSEQEFRQEMAAFQERTQQAQPQPPAPSVPAAGAVGEPGQGENLYAQHCAACHGAAGQGGIGPALTGADFSYGRSAEAVAESIRNGRPGGMPAFGNQLSAAEIDALTAFVLGLK